MTANSIRLKEPVHLSKKPLTANSLLSESLMYYSGDLSFLAQDVVSIVGSREASNEGLARTHRLATELASKGVVIMSGLAKGVDTKAHGAAITEGGNTVAVIGTPLTQVYPAENKILQEIISTCHLLISPFAEGDPVLPLNFPRRNRVMAMLSDATVIIEASDTSGTLHQATECLKQGRKLFIPRSVEKDPNLKWPSKFLGKPNVFVFDKTEDILSRL